jgi:hypothetical protein
LREIKPLLMPKFVAMWAKHKHDVQNLPTWLVWDHACGLRRFVDKKVKKPNYVADRLDNKNSGKITDVVDKLHIKSHTEKFQRANCC